MRKPATKHLPVSAPCLRCAPLPLFSPQQAMSAVRPSNDILSDNATDNREVREADPSPRPRIRNGFSSPASKDGGFQARNFCNVIDDLPPRAALTRWIDQAWRRHAWSIHLVNLETSATTPERRTRSLPLYRAEQRACPSRGQYRSFYSLQRVPRYAHCGWNWPRALLLACPSLRE